MNMVEDNDDGINSGNAEDDGNNEDDEGDGDDEDDEGDEDNEDDEGDEDDEDDIEDNGLFSSDDGPDDLNSGEKFCISDCRDEYPFLATYQTGLDLNLQQLCRNNRKTNLLTFQVAEIISFI